MGPTRTSHSRKQGDSAMLNQAGPSKQRSGKGQKEKESHVAPGVQKIKASLRQTRRLLAKDKLGADVRVETERRLKALEGELAQAEASKKERALAVRYHKIKFFERQKVVRKLNQTKKQLSTAETSSKPKLESSLLELRVDLNYILHYPRTKKYISLFPPEARQGKDAAETQETNAAKTDAAREELRTWIRGRMEQAELSQEPELHLDSRPARGGKGASQSEDWEARGSGHKPPHKKAVQSTTAAQDVEEDDFFGNDDEEEDDE